MVAVAFLLIGVTATFIHKVFPSQDQRQELLNSERSKLKSEWNSRELALDSLLVNRMISIENYLSQKKVNEAQRVDDFKEIAKKRNQFADDFSFNGRSSKNFWYWVFGTHLTLLIISLYLAYKDSKLKKIGLLMWYETPVSISFIAVSLFWMYHTLFLKSRDFQFSTYTLVLVLIVIPLSFFIYHSLRRIVIIEEKLLENIKELVSHVLHHTKEDREKEKWDVLDKVSKNGK